MKMSDKALTSCSEKIYTFFSHEETRANIFYGEDGRENRFYGSERNDTFYGGDGDNIFKGHGGDDEFHGGKGRNFFFGEDGNDVFYIHGTYNKVIGGPGRDKFVISPFLGAGAGETIITDFDVAASESIDLQNFSNIKSVEQLNIIRSPGNYSKITLSDNQFVTLKNIKPSELTENNFIFHKSDFIPKSVVMEDIQNFLFDLPHIINDSVSYITENWDGWFL